MVMMKKILLTVTLVMGMVVMPIHAVDRGKLVRGVLEISGGLFSGIVSLVFSQMTAESFRGAREIFNKNQRHGLLLEPASRLPFLKKTGHLLFWGSATVSTSTLSTYLLQAAETTLKS
jgi:hypothetical protein